MIDPFGGDVSSRPAERLAFIPRIEALRGLAALAVAGLHASYAQMSTANGKTGQARELGAEGLLADGLAWAWRMITNGHGAVILFFVISGFVLRLSLERMPGTTGVVAYRFFTRRALRLYPAVFVTLAIFAGIFYSTGAAIPAVSPEAYTPFRLIRNALLLEATIDGVTWTLQFELIGAFLVFCAFVAARRHGEGIVLIGFVILSSLQFTKFWPDLLHSLGFIIVGALNAFMAGMLAVGPGRRWVESLSAGQSTRLVALSAAALLLARPTLGQTSQWGVMVEVVSSAVLVAGLAFGRDRVVGSFLEWRLVRFYGRISYSFYLLHPLTLIFLWDQPELIGGLYRPWFPGVAIGVFLFVVSTAVVTPLAWLSYRYVEKPAMDLGRRLTRPGEPAGRQSLAEGVR